MESQADSSVHGRAEKVHGMLISFKGTPDSVDDLREWAPSACDDLLDVDQSKMNLVSPTSSICSRPCVSISVPTAAPVAIHSASLSREKILAQKIELVSKMERARRKLLLSMERSIETRSAIKRRRLPCPSHYSVGGIPTESIRQNVYLAMQDRIQLPRQSSR